jgi:hypothetical protein
LTPQVKSDTTIVFPDLELVCSNLYMVGVPCFFAKILCVQAHEHLHEKNPGDPNSTMSSVPNTPSPQPPDLPPLLPLVTTNHETGNVASATSNSSGGLSGAHCFVDVVSFLHAVVETTCNSSHINSNK